MQTLSYINFILAVFFTVCTGHKIVFTILKYLKKRTDYAELKKCRYAVVIAARNEEEVISYLLDSISGQDYPAELVDVYVVADNCTDGTAEIARQRGAFVYERFNKEQVGKGYALSYLFDLIKTEHADTHYDGYFVFDADNLLDSHYITEMNKVFSNGYPAVTSYRNTKNFTDSWVSACYGLWFLMESEYLNYPKSELGVSCAVSGTGFLFSDEVLEKNGGWPYHLMTEDLEFTADLITSGEKIGYCHNAVIYDEQPVSFAQSLTQRSRWMKGSLQVMSQYIGKLAKGVIKNGSFSSYDMLMGVIPTFVLSALGIILNVIMFFVGIHKAPEDMSIYFQSVLTAAFNSYLALYLIGLSTLLTEWKQIRGPAHKKILYSFGFPLFVLSFGVAVVNATFFNVEWKPIKHTAALSISDMDSEKP